MFLGLSREVVGVTSIVGGFSQARLAAHLLALLRRSICMLGGLLDRLPTVFALVWFAHCICDYPFAVDQLRSSRLAVTQDRTSG